MKYKYTGYNRDRKFVTGIVEAENEMEANLRLRNMQVRPQSLAIKRESIFEVFTPGGSRKNFTIPGNKPVTLKGLIVFTRQFSSLIDAGVPVVQCLDVLAQQERKMAFKRILVQLKADIESGSGLATALERHPSAFSDLYVRIVEAGEISGTLDTALRRVGNQLERLGRLRAKVIGAMVYPALTVIVAVVVLLFLLVKVIPEISKLYSESNAELPMITQKVLGLSVWVQNNFIYLIAVLLFVIFGAPVLVKVPAVRKVFDPFVLKVPGFGDLIKKSSIARLTRTMATLLASGVPLLTAFDICSRLISNLAIKAVIEQARLSVIEGKSIAAGFGQKKLFPPMVLHMVGIGEMTGKLDELLTKIADIYDDEVDDAVGAVTGMIQPAMIIVVGIIIAFLLLAMYLPIFQLAEKVTGGA
jgi:type IV pilus assembly protein PilC